MIKLGVVKLYIIPSRRFLDVVLTVLEELVKSKGMYGIYVSANRTAEVLYSLFRKMDINVNRVRVVDCVSCMVGLPPLENAVLVDSPSNLTEISIAVERAVRDIQNENKFLFLDSLSTLIVYNSDGAVEKFSHALTSRMKNLGFEVILASIEAEISKRVIDTVSQFVDEVKEVK